MLKLGILLVGFSSLRQQRPLLMAVGSLFVGLACLMIITPLEAADQIIVLLMSVPLFYYAFAYANSLMRLKGRRTQLADWWLPFLTSVLGVTIVGSVMSDVQLFPTLLITALYIDGIMRLAPSVISRYPAWEINMARSTVELGFATILAISWFITGVFSIISAIALLIAVAGFRLLYYAYILRYHQYEVSLLLQPIFGRRGWYDHAPVFADRNVEREQTLGPITLHVWLPALTTARTISLPIVNRYLMVHDRSGNVSVGHVALEVPPDLYISHYRNHDSNSLSNGLLAAIGPHPTNQLPGFFRSSYAEEQKHWGDSHRRIEFRRLDLRSLHAFWTGYRQDSTYYIVNRNCATLVSAALDVSIEGSLSSSHPLKTLLRLYLMPDFWQAAFVRSRAEAITWTPGLIHDYAEPLSRVLERFSSSSGTVV